MLTGGEPIVTGAWSHSATSVCSLKCEGIRWNESAVGLLFDSYHDNNMHHFFRKKKKKSRRKSECPIHYLLTQHAPAFFFTVDQRRLSDQFSTWFCPVPVRVFPHVSSRGAWTIDATSVSRARSWCSTIMHGNCQSWK